MDEDEKSETDWSRVWGAIRKRDIVSLIAVLLLFGYEISQGNWVFPVVILVICPLSFWFWKRQLVDN